MTDINQQIPSEKQNVFPSGDSIWYNIKKNRKLVLFFIIGFAAVLSVMFFSEGSSQSPQQIPTPTTLIPTAADSANQSTKQPQNQQTQDLNQSKTEIEIKTQTKPQLDSMITNPYAITVVKIYPEGWARMRVTTEDTNSASVIAKKENGTWKVLLGPGTYFDKESLNQIGAPQDVIQDIPSAQ